MISILALFVALGGTATALRGKNTVRSDDIKNGQVKSADIRNDAVLGRHVGAGAISGQEVQDGSITGGDVQDDGLTGADVQESSLVGVRPYGNVIPSGTTVVGLWGGGALSDGDELDFLVSLPAPAPAALTETTVNFDSDAGDSGIDDDPTCAGNVDAPTAPAGKVCLYDGGNVGGSPDLSGDTIGDPLSDRLGFIVIVQAAAGSVQAHGTWAYTAP